MRRTMVSLGIAMVLAGCALSDRDATAVEPPALPPPGPTRALHPPSPAPRAPATPPARLIVLGDSVSEGLGATQPSLSYAALLYRNDATAYPDDAGRDLAHLNPALTYINVAVAGDDTATLRDTQLPQVSAALTYPVRGPTTVVVTIGGNDLKNQIRPGAVASGETLQAALANLRVMVGFFRDAHRFPDGVAIYLSDLFDLTDGMDTAHNCVDGLVLPGFSAAVNDWNRAYAALGREQHITVVPIAQAFQGHAFNYSNRLGRHYNRKDPTLWISSRDCLHPNNRGHRELRDGFWKAINAGL